MDSSKRIMHFNARYFLLKDKIDKNKLEVKHRSTDIMRSHDLKKPKQGTHFRVFHGALMDISEHYYAPHDHNNVLRYPSMHRGIL